MSGYNFMNLIFLNLNLIIFWICCIFSDEDNTINPRVTINQDDLDIDSSEIKPDTDYKPSQEDSLCNMFKQTTLTTKGEESSSGKNEGSLNNENNNQKSVLIGTDKIDYNTVELNEYPLWAGDYSARRSPEGE